MPGVENCCCLVRVVMATNISMVIFDTKEQYLSVTAVTYYLLCGRERFPEMQTFTKLRRNDLTGVHTLLNLPLIFASKPARILTERTPVNTTRRHLSERFLLECHLLIGHKQSRNLSYPALPSVEMDNHNCFSFGKVFRNVSSARMMSLVLNH